MNGPISVIKYHGGLIAGQPLWIELWTPGAIIIVRDKEHVNLIQKIIREYEAMCERNAELNPYDYKTYLRRKLEEEYGW